MVKLALAIGFLAVFGFVAFALSLMLKNFFKNENDKINNQENKKSNKPKTNKK